MATIDDSTRASAQLLADLKKTTRLSEPTLVKLFEINVGWSMSRTAQAPSAPSDDPAFDQATADALLAERLGISPEGPEANETIDGSFEEVPATEPVGA